MRRDSTASETKGVDGEDAGSVEALVGLSTFLRRSTMVARREGFELMLDMMVRKGRGGDEKWVMAGRAARGYKTGTRVAARERRPPSDSLTIGIKK